MRYIKVKESEGDLQAKCEDWLEWERIPFLRIPDAVYRLIFSSNSVNVRLKAEVSKYLKGWPDLTIFQKCGRDNRVLCVELKSKTGKPTQGQKKIHKQVSTHIIRTFEDFKKLVTDWLDEEAP